MGITKTNSVMYILDKNGLAQAIRRYMCEQLFVREKDILNITPYTNENGELIVEVYLKPENEKIVT